MPVIYWSQYPLLDSKAEDRRGGDLILGSASKDSALIHGAYTLPGELPGHNHCFTFVFKASISMNLKVA